MRNKIKQMMNKEEGFTLVELLAVIVILGIILAISIPAIGSVINRADTNATTAEQELIVDAGRLYFVTEQVSTDEVSVDTLISSGYLEIRGDKPGGGVKRIPATATTGVTYEYDSSISN